MTTTVDEADLVATLADVLERVRGGERFEIERDGRVVAVLVPPTAKSGPTGREIAARIGHLSMPGDGFADDIESARAALLPARIPEWPD